MAIEWPNIAQGSGTGTTYTSPDNFTWRWTGSAWEGKGNSFRGFPQPWVIFSSDGSPTTYQTILTAMFNSSANDTIHLYGDVTEAPGIPFLHDIDINFNGHTLTFDYSLTANASDYGFYNTDVVPFKIKMYNGTVKYINESALPLISRPLIYSQNSSNTPSTFDFEGMDFITERSLAGNFVHANIRGGNFYTTSTTSPAFGYSMIQGLASTGSLLINEVYGESEKTTGIDISQINPSINPTYTFKNLVGVTKGATTNLGNNSGIKLFYGGISAGVGQVNVLDCIGINCTTIISSLNAGLSIISDTGNPKNLVRVSNCFGSSKSSAGIIASNCELSNCVADGYNSFKFSNVNASGCADLKNGNDIISESTSTNLVSQTGDVLIDNCAFSTGLVSSDTSSGTSLSYKVDIRNSTIYSDNNVHISLSSPGTATKIKINNNVVGFPGKSANPIIVSGGTGSEATNNVLFAESGISGNATAIAGSSTPMYLRSNILFGCLSTTHSIQTGTNISNQGNIVHPQ